METKTELRPEVLAFAQLMERELKANDHKDGWKDSDPEDLYWALQEETTELLQAIRSHLRYAKSNARSVGESPVNLADLAAEAADVANFAMMIADVCGELPHV